MFQECFVICEVVNIFFPLSTGAAQPLTCCQFKNHYACNLKSTDRYNGKTPCTHIVYVSCPIVFQYLYLSRQVCLIQWVKILAWTCLPLLGVTYFYILADCYIDSSRNRGPNPQQMVCQIIYISFELKTDWYMAGILPWSAQL